MSEFSDLVSQLTLDPVRADQSRRAVLAVLAWVERGADPADAHTVLAALGLDDPAVWEAIGVLPAGVAAGQALNAPQSRSAGVPGPVTQSGRLKPSLTEPDGRNRPEHAICTDGDRQEPTGGVQ